MQSQDWWETCGVDDPIRQGDIIRRSTATPGDADLGMVLTADCDIVQRKAGDRLTWLAVMPAIDYLRQRWAPEQLRRLRVRHTRPMLEALNGKLARTRPDLQPLGEASFSRWLETHDAEGILTAAAPGRPQDGREVGVLRALRIAAGHEVAGDPLLRLRAAQAALGQSGKQQSGAMRDALEGERGFPDFFLLPDLPAGEGIGHVVLLRDINGADAAEVFADRQDARFADRPGAFYRVARLHDGIRFAVTQKLAFLFSRIGLPSTFEDACTSATQLIVESAEMEARP